MDGTARVLGAALLGFLASGQRAAPAQVYLRGSDQPEAGAVAEVSAAGVTLRGTGDDGAGVRIIGWELVRRVGGTHEAQTEALGGLPDQAWRARARLARGDFAGAEPLLEAAAPACVGVRGPTPVLVFEGLTRCRLRRGAEGGALGAWLRWVESSDPEASATWTGDPAGLAPVIDARRGVAPELAPVWLSGAVSPSIVEALDTLVASTDARAREMAGLFRSAAGFEAGAGALLPGFAMPPAVGRSAGVELVREMVQARVGDDAQRKSSRDRLGARLTEPDLEPWVEAWCRVGIGRSLLRELDPALRRQGVIHLLHLPARLSGAAPRLEPIALAEAAAALSELGEEQGAATLKHELQRLFPAHPALGWIKLAPIKAAPPAAPPPGPEGGEA